MTSDTAINWIAEEAIYMVQITHRLPAVMVRGEGARIWDDTGKEYLDFMAGWAVNCLGHCHPAVVEAIRYQAGQLIQCSPQYYNIPMIELAKLLVQHSCLDRVFFCNSGAEANEGAVKLARKYGRQHKNGAFHVITTLRGFHGRTLAMVAATGKPEYQQAYLPLPEGFSNVAYNDIQAIQEALTDQTCAIMLELVQGEGGVNVAAPDYIAAVRRLCDQHNLLLIFDEVQTGIGRTGTLFAYEQYGIEPDVMTLAKGLGGGIPIGALLAKEHAICWTAGDHGSTFSGNPLTTATALATLQTVIEQRLPEHTAVVGSYLQKKLQELKETYKFIKEVRGRGLLQAMTIRPKVAPDLVKRCLELGVLINAISPHTLRFMPPLIISEVDVDEMIRILDQALSEVKLGDA